MTTYIYYAWPGGNPVIYILPAGDTVEDFVARYEFDPDNWAIFDPSIHPPDSVHYPSAFTLTVGTPNTLSFSLAAAKLLAIEQIKIYTARVVEDGSFLQNFTAVSLAAQASLDPVDRDSNAQAVIDNINDKVTLLSQGISDINLAADLPAVHAIVQSFA